MKTESYDFDLLKQGPNEILREISNLLQKHNVGVRGTIYVSEKMYEYLDSIVVRGPLYRHARGNGKQRGPHGLLRLYGRKLYILSSSLSGASIALKTCKSRGVCFSRLFQKNRRMSGTDLEGVAMTLHALIQHYRFNGKSIYETQVRIQRMFYCFENRMKLGMSLVWDVTDTVCTANISCGVKLPQWAAKAGIGFMSVPIMFKLP